MTDSEAKSFHIGVTAEHIGDITTTYDEDQGITVVTVFTDSDDRPDMRFFVYGQGEALAIVDNTHLVLAG